MLKLLFLKLEIGMDKILALGEMYKARGRRIIKPKRVKAIIN